MNFLAPLVAAAATTLSSPLSKIELDMIALTPKQVETKLDSIILFTPTNKDRVVIAGIEYKVIAINTNELNNTAITFDIFLR